MRRTTYKNALTALFFAGAWFILGFLFMLSPIPNALGIGGMMFQAWIVVFLVAMGIGGAMLTLAAFNGLFPPVVKPPRRRPASASATATSRSAAGWQSPSTTSTSTASRRDS